MRAFVRIRLADGQLRELVPGDIVGRAWSSTLQVHDPWVSEAHAMVSLREGALKLLGLRGKLLVEGQVLTEVLLRAPTRIALSEHTWLDVIHVHVPEILLALEHVDFGRKPLTGTMSLQVGGRLEMAPGSNKSAEAIFWTDGDSWYAWTRDAQLGPLEAGGAIEVAGHRIRIDAVKTNQVGDPTKIEQGAIESPLHILVRYETVHIHHRDREPPVVLDGQVARILSDLATAGVPVAWQVLAKEIWSNENDVVVLRRNWDAALARLRRKLREVRVRADLVRADRNGNFELFLRRHDIVVDET